MYDTVAASRPRCLVVATGLTAALWGAAAVLAGGLTSGRPAAPDQALVRLCAVVLLVALAWGWLQAMAGVADAWRGRPGTRRNGVRRLALVACGAACGVALVGALGAPSDAGPHHDPLSGLPMPDRAEGPARPRADTVAVRPGDSLWALAARDLGPGAGDRRVTERWHAIYDRNRGVIGPDPDLIRPGQVLRLTTGTKEEQK